MTTLTGQKTKDNSVSSPKTKQTTNKTKTKQTTNKTKTRQITNKTKQITPKTNTYTKFAGNPDYEFDTKKKNWVKKSDVRPVELVNRYKEFLVKFLKRRVPLRKKKLTDVDGKIIETLVNKYATSTERLKKMLVEKGVLSEERADLIMDGNDFWDKELCHHMKTICPTQESLTGIGWCNYDEDTFFYFKEDKSKHISCYSIGDIYNIIANSFTGGDDDSIFLQVPRNPYTRKAFTPELIKKFLKQLRQFTKEEVNNMPIPQVVYFLRNYKKFYSDPIVKKYIHKTTLTNKEKWELSEAIEKFMIKKNEIFHGWTDKDDSKRWWFWEEGKRPKSLYEYIFN